MNYTHLYTIKYYVVAYPILNKNSHNIFLTTVNPYLYSQKYVTDLVHIYMFLSKYIHNSWRQAI